MGIIVKVFGIFALILALSACQPAADDQKDLKESNPAATESKSQPKKDVNHSEAGADPEKSEGFSMVPGLPYEIIESDVVCNAPVVIEFFAYQCPHCYKLEQFAEAWKKENAAKIEFQAVPTHLGHQEFGPFLIVHQAAKNLGLLDKATPMLFKRLHEQKKSFASPDDAIAFLLSIGASEEDAKKALDDEEKIKTAIDDNFRLLAKYKITGVPAILVNHRYQFNVTKAGGYDKVFEVVEETLKLPSNCSKK